MQFPGLAVEPDAVPIKNPVGCVRILLDLKYHETLPDGVDAATGQEHGVARGHGDAVEAFRHGAGPDALFEFSPRHAALKAHVEFGAGIGIRDEPQLGFGFASQFGGPVGRRMDLKGKFLPRIQDFDQQRKPLAGICCVPENLRAMVFQQPMKVPAS